MTVRFKIQAGFWPKWDGEGEPTGPVFWDDEPNGECAGEEEARAALADLCETCGYDPSRFRVVPVRGPK